MGIDTAVSHGERRLVRTIPSKLVRRFLLLAIDPTQVLRLLGVTHSNVITVVALILAFI